MENTTYYKVLAVFAIGAIATLAFVGYRFADKKSAPVYETKIDELMFDNNNKAPKFVLTLPDIETLEKKFVANVNDNKNKNKIKNIHKKGNEPKTIEEIIISIPNIGMLEEKAPTQILKHIVNNDDLIENLNNMYLPKIAKDSKKAWVEYSKNVEIQPNFKQVALIIKGLGLDKLSLEKIAKGLDSEISFSISPYAQHTKESIISARLAGHETYVDGLLSSRDFMVNDNGPLSMSITIDKEEALLRLRKTLNTQAPIGGIIVNDGFAGEDNKEMLISLMTEVKNRGLLLIDATNDDFIDKIKIKGLPRRKADIVIDSNLSKEALQKAFAEAEETAFNKGSVVIVIPAKPVAIIEAYKWIKTFSPQVAYEEAKNMELRKPFALVPVSNVVME